MENVISTSIAARRGRTPGIDATKEGASAKARSRILYAGCSQARIRLFSELLGPTEHELVCVRSAEDAIALLSTSSIRLVLLDNSLAGMSAVELCRTLKGAAATQFLPIFVVSHRPDFDLEASAIEAGADAFLGIPMKSRIIYAHISSSLHRKKLVDRLDDSDTVLFSLAMSVEGRDGTLGRHCERLAVLGSAMGMLLKLPASDIVLLQRAGYLHDIGKVVVPDSILLKPGPLTAEEWRIMELHTIKGEQICSRMKSLQEVLPIIRHHHEKWDGSGYPDGLRGEEIPLLARIIQLADIYDALTTTRSYKPALSPAEAVAIIRAETEKGWLDPWLTERFADVLPLLDQTVVPDVCQLSLQALALKLENGMHTLRNSVGTS